MSTTKTIISLFCYIILLYLIMGCSDNDPIDENNTLKETKIVNLSNETYDVYIGRGIEYHTHMLAKEIKPGEEGWLGNPHPIGWCDICQTYHNRDECIERFKVDFYGRINSDLEFRNSVIALRGQRLGCYCKPKNCHGDVIKSWLDAHGRSDDPESK